jgi:glycosyltransferase involved in cell wall biosynthesis
LLRICIVLPGLSAGGTERVVSVLANEWIARGWAVTLLTLENADAVPYYRLDPNIEIRKLGVPPFKNTAAKAMFAGVRRVRALRCAFKDIKPDLVFSFLTRTNVMVLAAASGLPLQVVVSERNNPALQDVGPVWGFLRNTFYPRAFGLVTMTSGALAFFPPALRKRSWVIPNPVDLSEIGERRREGKTLVAVGRLVPQKGFDLLLQAFADVSRDHPEWTLVIWGEGTSRAELERQRDELGLTARVRMPGVTPKPGTWVETADVFVLSSRFEGWGIVLLEAMAADLPVVSFDCEWGPREMIEDEKNGILVERENVGALADALRRMLSSPSLRSQLGDAAGMTAREFTPQRIVDRWDEVALAAFGSRPDPRRRTRRYRMEAI